MEIREPAALKLIMVLRTKIIGDYVAKIYRILAPLGAMIILAKL